MSRERDGVQVKNMHDNDITAVAISRGGDNKLVATG